MIASVANEVGRFAKPDHIQWAPGLPKTRSGKIMRRILRKIAENELENLGDTSLGQALLAPTTIYVKALLDLFASTPVKALSHITGGGLLENIPRVLPQDLHAAIDTASWELPEVFRWLQTHGNVETTEMYRTFNCGVGMVLCVSPEHESATLSKLAASGHTAWTIGSIHDGANEVVFR